MRMQRHGGVKWLEPDHTVRVQLLVLHGLALGTHLDLLGVSQQCCCLAFIHRQAGWPCG